ncbi:MAG: ABC transporter permease [Thermoplasmatota archaeon]
MLSAITRKSFRDLSKRKARTFFTILTIALGVMGIGLFSITPIADNAADEAVKEENLHNIQIQLTDVNLTQNNLDELGEIGNIKDVQPKVTYKTVIYIGQRRNEAIIFGVDDFQTQSVDKIKITSGSSPESLTVLTENSNSKSGVFYDKTGDQLRIIDFQGEERFLSISGIGRTSHGSALTTEGIAIFYAESETVRTLGNITGYTQVAFTTEKSDTNALDKTTEDIRDYLSSPVNLEEPVVAFETMPDYREEGDWPFREAFTQFMTFITGLTFFIMFCSIILISNTMNTIIQEQRQNIAQMKAIGATKLQVFRSFLTTSLIMGVIGSLIGAILGIFIGYGVYYIFVTGGPWGFEPKFSIYWPVFFISIIIGVIVVTLASLPSLIRGIRITVREGLESHGITSNFGERRIDKIVQGSKGFPRTIQMGIRNSSRRRGRSFGTILQIAIAVGVVMTMLSVGEAIIFVTEDSYNMRLFDLWVFVDGGDPQDPIAIEDSEEMEKIEGVSSVEPFIISYTKINERIIESFGILHNTSMYDYPTTIGNGVGRWFNENEYENALDVAVVSEALAKYEGIKLNSEMELMTATGLFTFKVIGIEKTFANNGVQIHLPLTTFLKILNTTKISGFFMKTESKEHGFIDQTSVNVYNAINDQGYLVDVAINYVMKEQNVKQNQALSNIFLGVGFVVVIITLIGLMNTLLMNILDRTKEIGMLRCIGASSKDIRRVFGSEALLLSLIGWIIGIPLGYGLWRGLAYWTVDVMKLELPIIYPPKFILYTFAMTIIGTLIIILLPVIRASRFKPGNALRYE